LDAVFYPRREACGQSEVITLRRQLSRGRLGRRAAIEEDILTPLGVESSSYYRGELNGSLIRRLVEHADGIAIGVKQKLREYYQYYSAGSP
jgi:hypothetical protein